MDSKELKSLQQTLSATLRRVTAAPSGHSRGRRSHPDAGKSPDTASLLLVCHSPGVLLQHKMPGIASNLAFPRAAQNSAESPNAGNWAD